jgi:hypothetical protein
MLHEVAALDVRKRNGGKGGLMGLMPDESGCAN